jgi:hypothetical protein
MIKVRGKVSLNGRAALAKAVALICAPKIEVYTMAKREMMHQ